MKVLLVPDLPLERWPSMDRYAHRLAQGLDEHVRDVAVTVAGRIDPLTVDPTGDDAALPASGLGTSPPTSVWRELRRYAARYVAYPRHVRRLPGDVLHVLDHSYAHMLLADSSRPTVITVHDLLPAFSVKKTARGVRERLRNRLLNRVLTGLRRADAYIVATDWIKGELADFLGDDHRIHRVPYGVDEAFFGQSPVPRAEFRERFGIPEAAFVILHVGSVGPRKNLPIVIHTLAALRTAGVPAWFLQVGGTLTNAQSADIDARGLQGSVTLVGAAGEDVLRSAYRAADVLLFPSHYEGFGFPVLEAMASGLPAVASGAGALPEVAGDAAVIVNGREVEPYVAAVQQILDNPSWRDQLVSRGLDRAPTFTWAAAARDTAEVYRTIA